MRRTALHALMVLGAATVSLGAWAQVPGINDAPEDETAPNRDRERVAPVASDDAGTTPTPSASESAAPPPSASTPLPLASSAPSAIATILPPPVPDAPAEPEHVPSELGFSFGIRGSYAIPFGTANGGPLNGVMQGLFPVGIDLGWFFTPNLYVGGYGLYGFAVGIEPSSETCSDPDESCSATFLRFGITAEWHFRPHEFYDPWVGVGFGYEVINLSAGNQDSQDLDESEPLHGFELLNLRAGLDFKPQHYYGLGPFVELSTGHYATDSGSAFALHEWLGFGLRLHSGI